MSKKSITTDYLNLSQSEFKQFIKELEQVSEFRNQLTLDTATFETHSRNSIKAIGTACHLIEILRHISKDFNISLLKENGSITSVQLIG